MKLGKVVGRVVCTQKVEALDGIKLMLIQPLTETLEESGDVLVAMDAVQAGEGDIIYYESSKEAGQAFNVWFTPADVAIFGIVDKINLGKTEKTK